MADCSDNTYYIYYTDPQLGVIVIPKSNVDVSLDIAFPGKTYLEYGERFVEDMLRILERHASPSASEPVGVSSAPDPDRTFDSLLESPVIGQLWFNRLNKRSYFFNGVNWVRLSRGGDVSGNSGLLDHGEQIPAPVANDGYVFPYSECAWTVSPYLMSQQTGGYINGFVCETDATANVTMQYTLSTGSTIDGKVVYQIIGIRDQEDTLIDLTCPPPSPTPTPTVSVSSVTPTPTPTISSSSIPPTPDATPTPTPTVDFTTTPTPTPTITPEVTPTPTMTVTPSTVVLELQTVDVNESSIISEGDGTDPFLMRATFATNYSISIDGTNGPQPIAGSSAWLVGPPGSSSDYEILFSGSISPMTLDDSAIGAVELGTWYTLNTNRVFALKVDNPQFGGNPGTAGPTGTATVTVSIREIANTSNVTTGTLTLTVDTIL